MRNVVARLVEEGTNRGAGIGPVVYLIEESGGRLWFRREGDALIEGSDSLTLTQECTGPVCDGCEGCVCDCDECSCDGCTGGRGADSSVTLRLEMP